jgi:hypothetical protein
MRARFQTPESKTQSSLQDENTFQILFARLRPENFFVKGAASFQIIRSQRDVLYFHIGQRYAKLPPQASLIFRLAGADEMLPLSRD